MMYNNIIPRNLCIVDDIRQSVGMNLRIKAYDIMYESTQYIR